MTIFQFRDQYHVRKALEENNPNKNMANQITDGTRQDPIDAPKNHHATTKVIKDSELSLTSPKNQLRLD
ncbi:MAG: hypothetical protein WA364_29730 [Candidatus Nitrosopolaris sp.]